MRTPTFCVRVAFLQFLIILAASKQHQQTTIHFKAKGVVKDNYELTIAGINVDVIMDSQLIGTGQTDGSGQYLIAGTISKQNTYKVVLQFKTISNIFSVQFDVDGVQQGDSVEFQKDVKLAVDDVQSGAPFSRGNIQTKVNTKDQPISNAELIYTVVFLYNGVKTEESYTDNTNQQGSAVSYLLLPSGAQAVVQFKAKALHYWNHNQIAIDDPAFMLSAQNAYRIYVDVKMTDGQIKQIIKGKLVDSKQRPILGSTVTASLVLDTKQITSSHTDTNAQGEFLIELKQDLYQQLQITIDAKNSKFEDWTKTITQVYDLDDSTHIEYTSDLGVVVIKERQSQLTISGHIIDKTKLIQVVPNAAITIKYSAETEQSIDTKSDDKGYFKVEAKFNMGSKVIPTIKVTAVGFVEQTIKIKEQLLNKDESIVQDIQLDRIIVNIKISDILVDQNKKAISSAIVSILNTDPKIISADYTKSISSDNNGQFIFPFTCYQTIQLSYTFRVLEDMFKPVEFTTGKLDCADQNLKQNQLTMNKQPIDLTITGKIVGPDGKIKTGIDIDLVISPQLQLPQHSAKSDTNGQWAIHQIPALPMEKYSLTVNYKNDIQQVIASVFDITTTKEKVQTISLSTIFYQALLTTQVQGKVTSNGQPILIPIPLVLNCDAVDKSNVKIKKEQQTKSGQYLFEFELLAENDQQVDCNIQNGQSSLIVPFKKLFKLSQPDFKITENIEVEYNQAFIAIKGVITDQTKYVNFVDKAAITLVDESGKILGKATTNDVGLYLIELHIKLFDKIKYQLQIEAEGFLHYQNKLTELYVEQMKETLEINVQLYRILVDIKITDIIVDLSGKPIIGASAQVLSTVPTIQGTEFYRKVVQTQSKGDYSLEFQCYEFVSFTAIIQIDLESFQPYSLPVPKHDCADINLGLSKISLEKQHVQLTIHGNLEDPHKQGKSNVELSLSLDPPINQQIKVKTNESGNWVVDKITIDAEVKYKITCMYINILKENVNSYLTYLTTLEKQQTVTFPQMYYQDLVPCTIDGTVKTSFGNVEIPIPLIIQCEGKGKDGKQFVETVQTKPDGSYSFKFDILAESDQSIKCKIITGSTPSVQPFKCDVVLTQPKYTINQNIELTYNTFDMVIRGVITDAQKLIHFIPGIEITLTSTPRDALIPLQVGQVQGTSILKKQSQSDGKYDFQFKIIAGQVLSITIQTTNPDFIDFIKKGIVVNGQKSETLDIDIELDRLIISTKIHSSLTDSAKKPIQNAEISIISSNPQMTNSKSYNVAIKDDNSGSFLLAFDCYLDIEYIVEVLIVVPTYLDIKTPSSKFKCTKQQIELVPIVVELHKAPVTTIIQGKVINPYGKPQSNLDVSFSTKPPSTSLNIKTASDGIWTANDPNLIPNQQYQALLQFSDILKEIISLEQNLMITSANQKIQYQDAFYPDIVKFQIQGKVTSDQGLVLIAIKMSLSCDSKGINGKSPLVSQGTSSNGAYTLQNSILATFNTPINCLISSDENNSVQPFHQKVIVKSPTFISSQDIKVIYNSYELTITGKVTDKQKLVTQLENIEIIINIQPKDPFISDNSKETQLQSKIITKSKANGVYSSQFKIIAQQIYTIMIETTNPDFIDFIKKGIVVNGQKSETLDIDIELDRLIISTKIHSSLTDSAKKPIQNAELSIISSNPQMTNSKSYNVAIKDDNSGSFLLAFDCYLDIEYIVEVLIVVPTYLDIKTPSSKFKCTKQQIELVPIVVELHKAPVSTIIEGKIINPYGKPQSNLDVSFSTKPPSTSLNIKTASDGIWTANDPNLIPNQQYQALLQFSDILKELVSLEQNLMITSANQKIQYQDAFYPDIVKFQIQGKVTSDQGLVLIAIKMSLSCDSKGINGKSPLISQGTSSNGAYTLQNSILATFNTPINCLISSDENNSVQPFHQKVIVKSPTFISSQDIKVIYNSYELTITGKVTDKQKLVTNLENIEITITLQPKDPFIAESSQTESKIIIKSKQNGLYSTIIKIIAQQSLTLMIQTSNPDFNDFIQKGIVVSGSKSETLNIDIDLQRVIIQAKIHSSVIDSSKKPVQNAEISIVTSNPVMADSKSYSVKVKDDNSGAFLLAFDCYLDIEYIVEVLIVVPTYLDIKTPSSKFKCTKQQIELVPIVVELHKAPVSTIIEGKIINPYGKPQSNLDVSFSTKPPSTSLNIKTASDGIWTANDPNLIPNQQYQALLQFSDILKELVSLEQNLMITSANQKIQYQDAFYPDIVKFQIQGKVTSDQGLVLIAIKMSLSCDSKGINGKSPLISQGTSSNGAYTLQNSILATFNTPINCLISSDENNSVQPFHQKVIVKSPTFISSQDIKVIYNSYELTITGKVTDKQKLVTNLENIEITITLQPKDPFIAESSQTESKIIIKSKQNGLYSTIIKIIAQQSLTLMIQTSNPDFNDFIQKGIVVSGSKSETLNIDIDLQRVIIQAKIHSSVIDSSKKPVQNAEISIVTSNPVMADSKSYSVKVKDDNSGAFVLPFDCYLDVTYTLDLKIQVRTYPPVFMTTQSFLCQKTDIELSPFIIKLLLSEITIIGSMVNPYGVGQKGVEITITTEPSSSKIKTKTDSKGDWKADLELKVDQKYKLIVSYEDTEDTKSESEDYTTELEANKHFKFKDLYYADNVELTFHGKIESTRHLSIVNDDIYLDCNGDKANGRTDLLGKYHIQLEKIISFQYYYSCSISNKNNSKYQTKVVNLKVNPPEFKYEVNIVVDETPEFKNMVEKNYVGLKVTGVIFKNLLCNNVQESTPVRGALVNLVEWLGTDYEQLNIEDKSDAQGRFTLYAYILKSQLQNIFGIEITKDNYVQQSSYFQVPKFKDAEKNDLITSNLGSIQITPIDMGIECKPHNQVN